MNARANIYQIKPIVQWDYEAVQEYWQLLYMHDRLKYRLCDVEDPTWADVIEMITHKGKHMYMVGLDDKIVGEFLLENFTGRAAQMHFSVRPGLNAAESFALARFTSDQLLESYLDTLFGLTPASNRAALIYNMRAGFKRVGVLHNGMTDRGKVVDAYLMVKENRHGR